MVRSANSHANSPKQASKGFAEAIVITDEQDWIWNFAKQALHRAGLSPLRLPSSVSLRDSRSRLDCGRPVVIDWACRQRPAAAIIEELQELYGNGEMADRIIVLASDVIREDALYFGELGVSRLLVLRNRDVELARANRDFLAYWQAAAVGLAKESANGARSDAQWRSLLRHIDTAIEHFWEKREARHGDPSASAGEFATASGVSAERALGEKAYAALIERARGFLSRDGNAIRGQAVARDLDLEASLLVLLDRPGEALDRWVRACEANPNFHRAQVNLSRCLRHMGRHEEALAIIRNKHEQNRKSIGLLVEMGDIHLAANELEKAQHHYQLALERDAHSSPALNGMAQVRFAAGDLKECRDLLARSGSSAKVAARFNAMGIELVRGGRFAEALDLYNRAQFVLPQQEKGPMLFYNMGLCYWRWGRCEIAREFIKLALIKDPAYAKAKSLLARIESGELT
jgi:tetratricopeptide (TPR) repeat protein